VQGFGSFPTQISKFWGLGEPYATMDPGTDQLCTRGLVHIKEDVKLNILLGGGLNPGGSWLLGAGVWKFPHTNFEIFGSGGSIWTHGSRHRLAMAMGVLVYSRGRQTTCSIRWRN
jgi:hypothetical protein